MGVLSSQIQALITYANETTNAGDTKLGDAVQSLIDGYGGGGGGGSADVMNIGKNPVLIKTYSEEWGAADTSFVIGTTAPTSATSIKSSTSYTKLTTTQYPDLATKDIVVIQNAVVIPTYDSTESGARVAGAAYSIIHNRCILTTMAGSSSFTTKTTNQKLTDYYKATGARALMETFSGIYPDLTSPTFAGTLTAPTIQVKSAAIYAITNNTYMTADNMKKITDFVCKYEAKVYLVDRDTSVFGTNIRNAEDMLTDGNLPE